jgi:hypothetical protein
MQGVAPAFIDFSTYGELEKRMYSREGYRRRSCDRIILVVVIFVILFYLKKK